MRSSLGHVYPTLQCEHFAEQEIVRCSLERYHRASYQKERRETRDAGDVVEQAIRRYRLRTINTGFIFTSASRLISTLMENTA